MKIIILNRSEIPLYEQIKMQVKEAILSGELKEGDMLPSLRKLAKDLSMSVLTVTKAYSELEQEGYVTNVQGKGCYVLPKSNEVMREKLMSVMENHFTEGIKLANLFKLPYDEVIKILNILYEEERRNE